MAMHWNESEAVKKIEVPRLDKERETILKAIDLAMNVPDAWPATLLALGPLFVCLNECD